MVIEEWRPVTNYPDRYLVSSFGNIKILARKEFMPWNNSYRYYKEKMMSIQTKDNNYLFVVLSDGSGASGQRPKYVHRLVAESFIGPIPSGHVVNHKDGNKKNNYLNNIEIISQRDNCIHASLSRKKTSKYPGVHFEAASKSWKSMARMPNGGKKYLGKFNNEEDAYNAYKQYVFSIESNIKHIKP